jgi:hypothetical protein
MPRTVGGHVPAALAHVIERGTGWVRTLAARLAGPDSGSRGRADTRRCKGPGRSPGRSAEKSERLGPPSRRTGAGVS